MTTVELHDTLEEMIRAVGLSEAVNWELSQVLDFPDAYFVEVVLNDASKLHEAERVLAKVAGQLGKNGVQVDWIVRALWEVREVEFFGPARSEEGTIRTALTFKVLLQSGARRQEAYVDVTFAALDRLREKRGITIDVVGWAPQRGDVSPDALAGVVRDFLTLQLSDGGTSYWDPIRLPRQELTAAAMSYLLDRLSR